MKTLVEKPLSRVRATRKLQEAVRRPRKRHSELDPQKSLKQEEDLATHAGGVEKPADMREQIADMLRFVLKLLESLNMLETVRHV